MAPNYAFSSAYALSSRHPIPAICQSLLPHLRRDSDVRECVFRRGGRSKDAMIFRLVGLRSHHTAIPLRFKAQSQLQSFLVNRSRKQQQLLSARGVYQLLSLANDARLYSSLPSSSTTAKEKDLREESLPPPPQGSKKVSRWVTRRLLEALLWVPVVAFVSLNLGTVGIITGQSMSPTFNADPPYKTVVLINRYAAGTVQYVWSRTTPKKQNLRIGDVVIMKSPLDPREVITKRILALPGDIITRRRSSPFSSSSSSSPSPATLQHTRKDGRSSNAEEVSRVLIPPGHMWVEGDASVGEYKDEGDASHLQVPSNVKSRDSRTFGPVPMGLAFGRIDYILHPFSHFGPVPGRPNFDATRANEMRSARERNENPFSSDMQSRRAHPDDSTVSPYSDWEWVVTAAQTDSKGGSKPTKEEEEAGSSSNNGGSKTSKNGRSRRDDDFETIWRDQLNRLSRGGQLGHHLDYDKKDD